MTSEIDEINEISKTLSIPYEQYFDEMELTEEQKKQRINLAKDLENDMLFFFSLILVLKEYSYTEFQFAIDSLLTQYKAHLGQYMDIDEYINDRVNQFATDTLETTQKHIDDDWFTSNDRAMLIAENEANASWNYEDYRNAIKQGKTKKKWITMRDKRVRHTHQKLDGKTIPINSIFLIGNSEMYFPKDESFYPETTETANCRCSIKYL